jgi:hypothetical protein
MQASAEAVQRTGGTLRQRMCLRVNPRRQPRPGANANRLPRR